VPRELDAVYWRPGPEATGSCSRGIGAPAGNAEAPRRCSGGRRDEPGDTSLLGLAVRRAGEPKLQPGGHSLSRPRFRAGAPRRAAGGGISSRLKPCVVGWLLPSQNSEEEGWMRGLGPMAVGERRDPRRALVQTGDMVRLHRRRPRRALDAAPSRFQTPCLCGYIHQSIFLMLYCAKCHVEDESDRN